MSFLSDLLDGLDDVGDEPSILGRLRRERPGTYHGVLIAIVIVLAAAVYAFVW
jgi:hypothetical protein